MGDPWGAWSHCGADAARQRERNCRKHALHGNGPRRALSGPPGSPGVRVVLSLMTAAPAVYAIGDGEVLFLEGSAVIFPQTLRHSVLPPPGRAPPPLAGTPPTACGLMGWTCAGPWAGLSPSPD